MRSIDTFKETGQKVQEAVLQLFKGLSFTDRVLQGAIMAFQATFSACIAYVIGANLHSEQAVWAAITAIAVTQHSYTDTMHLSRDQFVGAMVGGLLGFLGAILGDYHHLAAYAITLAFTIVFCWCVNVGSAARLGGITATIVLLFPSNGPIWDIPLIRLGEVTLGTACALLTSWMMSKIEGRWFDKH